MQALSLCWPQTEVWAVSNMLPVQAPTLFPSLCSDAASGPSPLCPSQRSLPKPPLPLPCCGAISQGSWGTHELSGYIGFVLWWTGYCQSSELLLRCCLSTCQQWSLLPHPDATPEPSHLYILQVSFFPGHGSPRSSATL